MTTYFSFVSSVLKKHHFLKKIKSILIKQRKISIHKLVG